MKKSLNINLKILLKSSFIILLFLFLIGCKSQLESTMGQVSDIDSRYNVNLSDYEHGLVYFSTHLREINDSQSLLNVDDFEPLINELQNLKATKTDNASRNYLDFRIALFKAEGLYKKAARKPKVSYKGYIICRLKNYTLESISEAKEAINYSNDAISMYNNLDFKDELDINPNWTIEMQSSNKDLSKYLKQRTRAFNVICKEDNKTDSGVYNLDVKIDKETGKVTYKIKNQNQTE